MWPKTNNLTLKWSFFSKISSEIIFDTKKFDTIHPYKRIYDTLWMVVIVVKMQIKGSFFNYKTNVIHFHI